MDLKNIVPINITNMDFLKDMGDIMDTKSIMQSITMRDTISTDTKSMDTKSITLKSITMRDIMSIYTKSITLKSITTRDTMNMDTKSIMQKNTTMKDTMSTDTKSITLKNTTMKDTTDMANMNHIKNTEDHQVDLHIMEGNIMDYIANTIDQKDHIANTLNTEDHQADILNTREENTIKEDMKKVTMVDIHWIASITENLQENMVLIINMVI